MIDDRISSAFSKLGVEKLFVLLGALILALALLVVGNLVGVVDQSTASIVSSFTLVVVTAVYAYQTTKSVEYTEKSLGEMKRDREKPGIILVVAYGIDPLLDEVESRSEKWDEQAEMDSLPPVDELEMPDEEFLSDLNSQYPGVTALFSDYLRETRVYRIQWDRLNEELEQEILEEYEELLRELIDDEQREQELLEMYPEIFARNILELSGMRRAHSEEWSEVRNELLPLREMEFEVEGGIDTLAEQFDTVQSLNQDLIDHLSEVRSQYKLEYGITDLEIEEAKQESILEEPDVIKNEVFV
jgi:hypothetical protein